MNLAGLSNTIVYSTFFANIVPIKSLVMKGFIVHEFFLLIPLLITGHCNESMRRQPPPEEVGGERLLSDFH